jgi:sugar lactone lactonase YvrE
MDRYQAEILTHPGAALGEGPLADGPEHLIWVDIPNGVVWRTELRSGRSFQHKHSKPVSAIGHCKTGGFVIAAELGFASLRSLDDTPSIVMTIGENSGLRLNDGKVDPWGRFVAGTAVIGGGQPTASLNMLDASWRATELLTGITMSNGLDWSPDKSTFYYVDTPTRRVDRFDVDPDTGELLNRYVFASIDAGVGLPDGLTVDAEGGLWLAVWGAGAVLGFSPDGRQIARIEVPASCTTSCTFGDSDGRTLFITSARGSENDASALAGAVFAVRLPVCGQPVRYFG